MKIVVALDSFKGSASAVDIGNVVCKALNDTLKTCETVSHPIADGGEGMIEAIVSAIKHKGTNRTYSQISCNTVDPLMRPIKANYIVINDNQTAVIELASASGLPLVETTMRNPLKTSTYGTGIMIKNAIEHGCRQFIIGLGGSATNDGGMGLLTALGYKFTDDLGQTLEPIGINLPKVVAIDDSEADNRLSECRFTAACDVNNPLIGPNGAAPIFAPQKGADDRMVKYLDNGLAIYAQAIERHCGMDISGIPGAGAAGGVGGGITSLLKAELKSGSEIILDITNFDSQIADADFIITGEGQIDAQSTMGKAINAILDHADKAHVPVIGMAGSIDVDNIDDSRFAALFSILQSPMQLEKAMDKSTTLRNAYFTARQIAKLINATTGKCIENRNCRSGTS